jgi:hypothetical protein
VRFARIDSTRVLVPEGPENLAALRISVAILLLISPETYSGPRIAALPAELRIAPEGLGWLVGTLPVTPGFARGAQWILVVSSIFGLVGLWTRASLAIAAVSGVYVLGLFQLTGSVTHDMHLLWFAALCAAGPSGDALSLDRTIARRRGVAAPLPSLRVAVPLFFARVLLGLVYFFPGFWKLATSGIDWVTTDNLKNQMHWKWFQNGAVPSIRIDRWDGLVHAGALGVVLLELTFPLLVILPRTRLVAAIGGFAFHVLSQIFLFIPFPSLWGCYTMLVDFRRPRVPEASRNLPPFRARLVEAPFAAALGIVFASLVFVQGARNRVQAWPFACYPTFQWTVGDTMPDLVLEAVAADGSTRLLPDGPGGGGARGPDGWAMAWNVAGLYSGHLPSPETLRAYLAHARENPAIDEALRAATAVRFYRAWYSVRPEDWGKAPVRAERIGDVSVRSD